MKTALINFGHPVSPAEAAKITDSSLHIIGISLSQLECFPIDAFRVWLCLAVHVQTHSLQSYSMVSGTCR